MKAQSTAAMIFAAGKGTRLAPFTDAHPKALVPVGAKPMLQHVIERVAGAGVEHIVVNVHHFAGQIIRFLEENNNFRLDITVSDESELLLDTGGGLRKASAMLSGFDRVLLHNADILTDINLEEMLAHHTRSGNDATLLVAPRVTSRYLYFDSQSLRLHGWRNENTGASRPEGFVPGADMSPMAFGGVHVVSRRIMDALKEYEKPDVPFSMTPFYVDNCNTLNIGAYVQPQEKHWFDVGTNEKLQKAVLFYERH